MTAISFGLASRVAQLARSRDPLTCDDVLGRWRRCRDIVVTAAWRAGPATVVLRMSARPGHPATVAITLCEAESLTLVEAAELYGALGKARLTGDEIAEALLGAL